MIALLLFKKNKAKSLKISTFFRYPRTFLFVNIVLPLLKLYNLKEKVMIKQIVYISQSQRLFTQNSQLLIADPKNGTVLKQMPIEELGFLVLDHAQIQISMVAIEKLLTENVALVFCNEKHLPIGLTLPLEANTLQNERFRAQIEASESLKKQLWKQVVEAKILNQAALLEKWQSEKVAEKLLFLAKSVKSGDAQNAEAQAARLYWQHIFLPYCPDFVRERFGLPPNHLLNYGYTLLRAAMARALVGAGLLPTLGIFHHNRYNAYCLADDMMEAYRPWVDDWVCQKVAHNDFESELKTEHKKAALEVLFADVKLGKETKPLMLALSATAASLQKCFEGTVKKLSLPKW